MNTTTQRFTLRLSALGCALATVALTLTHVQAQNMPMTGGNLPPLRPPSVPLVAHDPYFSIWSNSNKLYSDETRHWTGRENRLNSMVRVDGQTFRLMGSQPEESASLPQKDLLVLPTRTIYTFANEKVQVQVVFLTPAIPSDLEVLSRPVTYVSYLVRSLDGKTHNIQFYTDAGADITVNDANTQQVTWERATAGNLTALSLGSVDQPFLGKRGDDLRIDWGHLYVAAPNIKGLQSVLSSRANAQEVWGRTGNLPTSDDTAKPRTPNDNSPVGALAFNVGSVGSQPVKRTMMLAYDDEYSINWMGHRLRPYWRRNGMDAMGLLNVAARDYEQLNTRSAAFDTELMDDLRAVGGEKYARLTALAHRQALAAQKVVADANGAPLSFSKENNSNGSVGTVDVFYPASPQMMMLSPTLLKATMEPILLYSAGPRWPFPFAPHDVGVYPQATGMLYGGGENIPANGDVSGKMPVEESGNMLIMLGALSKIEGNTKYADRFWPTITKWADFLISKGYDLDNQLSTDDFSGHLAHNVNLSGKSIEAIGAYAQMCEMRGDSAEGKRVRGIAEGMSKQWQDAAKDGDHYKLAFNRPGTWSQKYNLVWDKILGLNLFPNSVAITEMTYYKTKLNRYGLPLDSRENYTKLDWTIWSAALTGNKADVVALADPVYDFLNYSPSRLPMTDWYRTIAGTQVGFKARSVVGGVFIPVLNNPSIWNKWASRDLAAAKNINLNWAPLPPPQQITTVLQPSAKTGVTWSYTTEPPAGNWSDLNYNDAAWPKGAGGFGSQGTPGPVIGTPWTSDEIWARREFTLTADQLANRDDLQLMLYHDDDTEVYLNGVQAANIGGANGNYEMFPISKAALAALKPGKNILAAHVRDTGGDQYLDAGIVSVK
ncbi:hypothetical protein IAD21_06274 [Abditibacteriota bacterium]|nr:hypothetical protein IAD21_06274 [Abditibacteriota bacterium]